MTLFTLKKLKEVEDYLEPYRYAMTPWFVSELKGEGSEVDVKKLFRFYSISDGNASQLSR